jgi:uncharacterized protein YdaU (DUF1376 family)
MSKDPAVLFYTSDFLTGTMTMTNEQVGMYIRLLCLQHQKYVLTEKDMMSICKSYDDDIFSKFEQDEEGYYNKRMRDEFDKRKSYSESRRNNRKGKTKKHMKNISKTYDKHMENENENEDININETIFIEFWNLYNKKVNKESAFKAFKKVKQKDYEHIRKNIPLFIKQFTDKQFQPHFSTYLNGKRWEDEIGKENKFEYKNLANLNDD